MLRRQSKKFKFKASRISWNEASSSRRREFRGMRRTYVRRSEHEMKRNAEIGLFTKPSKIMGLKVENHITTDVDQNCLLF